MQENQTKKYSNYWLHPTEEEQALRLLQGKCPHNKDWNYLGKYAGDYCYFCQICGERTYV